MIKRWNILPDAGTEAQALAKALGVSDVLARLLWNRGLRTVDDCGRSTTRSASSTPSICKTSMTRSS